MNLDQFQISTSFSNWTNIFNCSIDELKNRFKVQNDPFLHIVCDNFFTPEGLLHLADFTAAIPNQDYILHPNGYCYAGFPSEGFFKFIYGHEMRKIFKYVTGLNLVPCKKYPFPQVYRFPSLTSGLNIHNDANEGRSLAMIFYIQSGWKEGFGGEIALYSKTNNGFREIKSIPPIENTLVAFELNQDSWHAVKPVNSSWERKTLIIDWNFQ